MSCSLYLSELIASSRAIRLKFQKLKTSLTAAKHHQEIHCVFEIPKYFTNSQQSKPLMWRSKLMVPLKSRQMHSDTFFGSKPNVNTIFHGFWTFIYLHLFPCFIKLIIVTVSGGKFIFLNTIISKRNKRCGGRVAPLELSIARICQSRCRSGRVSIARSLWRHF